ncbi:MAG TPA: DUF6607 family protein [Puia sp.]|nr:DUF6607 family protein [Puia sp.]
MKGKWTQSVWEVSDAPRYQGASEWLTTDGKTFWENTADAPLLRREYTVRSDYNVMRRTNRIILTDSGWVHDQYNQKIVRAGGVDKLLVEEKGLNTYFRTDMKYCAAAKNYWEKNKGYWEKVRNAWADYMGSHSRVEMKNKVDGKALYDYLFELADDYAGGKVKADAVDATIRADIEKFMGHEEQPVVQK